MFYFLLLSLLVFRESSTVRHTTKAVYWPGRPTKAEKALGWIVLTTTCLPAGRYEMYNINLLTFNACFF